MDKSDPIGLENPLEGGEKRIESAAAHMLEHAYRHDAIVLAHLFAVVALFKGDLIRQAGLRCAVAGGGDLFGRQAEPGHAGLVLLRKLHRQSAPARADIENLQTGPQQQLCCDVLFLEAWASSNVSLPVGK